jgi:exocyst complex component 3
METLLGEALQEIASGMERFGALAEEIKEESREYKRAVEKIKKQSKSLEKIPSYSLVRAAARSHRNIERTKIVYGRVREFGKSADALERLLQSSLEHKSSKSLLQAHEGVTEAESLLGEREEYPGDSLFAEIKRREAELRDLFDLLLFTLVDDIASLIHREGLLPLIKILKIVRAEEKRDEIFKIEGRPRRYRERFFEGLISSIDGKTRAVEFDSSGYISPSALSFVLGDIRALHKTKRLGLPRELDLFDFCVLHYHRGLYTMFEEKAPGMDPNEALSLLSWSATYYESMFKDFGKTQGALGPKLFHGREEELVRKYAKAAREKLKKWIQNLAEMETEKFASRTRAPDLDPENRFISVGFIDLLHIMKQQLEPVSFHPELFRELVSEISANVEHFKHSIFKVMDKELDLFLHDKGSSGFEEYCISVGNSGLKFIDCLSDLPFYTDKGVQEISVSFFDFLEKSTSALVSVILETISPVIKNLFKEKWYDEPIIETAIATFKDYVEDYQVTMVEYAFETFIKRLVEEFAYTYLERMASRKSEFRADATSRMVFDKKALVSFFSRHIPREECDSLFKSTQLALSIITSESLNLAVLEVNALVAARDVPRDLVKKLVSKRPGITKEKVAEVLSKAKWRER